MKLRLRYILVFLMGMACMYWMVRTGALDISPMYQDDVSMPLPTDVVVNTGVNDADVVTGDSLSTGDTSSSTGEIVSGDQDILDTTVSIMQGSEDIVVVTDESASSDSKNVACTKSDGNYDSALIVGWNDILTASTQGYVKRGSFLHYVVSVSDGSKYYFYHNCGNGTATNVQNLTSTDVTRVVLSNGQVYLR